MPYAIDFDEYHAQDFLIAPPNCWPEKLRFKRSNGDQSYAAIYDEESNFRNQFLEQQQTSRLFLKYLCPDTLYYRSLFSLVPALHEAGYREDNDIIADHIEKIGSSHIKRPVRYLMNKVSGQPLCARIKEMLQEKGLTSDNTEIIKKINKQIVNEFYPLIIKIFNVFATPPPLKFEDEINRIFNALYQKLFYSICSEYYLSSKRSKLSGWISKTQKGTALFVDAPMGLGKTYSMVEGLATNFDLSAIVYLPTKRLCHSFCVNLADRIAEINGTGPTIRNGRNYDKTIFLDGNGGMYEKYTTHYLERNSIYVIEGINKYECPHYEKIIEGYSKYYFSKKSECSKCEKENTCRFLRHRENARKNRIVVTTHAMYDHIFNSVNEYKWDKYDDGKMLSRDLFLIDEDLIFTNCYQPICLDEDAFREFIATITNFLNDPDWFETNNFDKNIFFKFDSLLAQFVKCDVTSYIPPVDSEFSFSEAIKSAWHESLVEREDIVPDILNTSNLVGNYLEIIEKAIQVGFVTQKYNLANGLTVRNIYLPNPKTYRFGANIPKHVFFDGTLHDKDLLEQKLRNVNFEYITISLDKPFWEIKAYQNINTDLPKSKVPDNENAIKKLLLELIPEIGLENRFFILTSKTLQEKIQQWLNDTFSGTTIILEHYGNLRGVNTAKECNVGIVLGSYILSDAVEIALAIDFISEDFKDVNPVPIPTLNHFWTWQGRKGERKYKEPYEIVEKVSNQYRYAEYRQAIARTRYLFHPVNFYVFSKDKIDEYEPFIPKVETYQYKNNMFPVPIDVTAKKIEQIENAIFDWFKNNTTVSATDIHKKYSIRRQTVSKHLKQMCESRILTKADGYKKRYKMDV
jgi:hypothetical protein